MKRLPFSFFGITFCLMFSTTQTCLAEESLLYGESDTFPKIRELNWLNEQFLDKQRTLADEVTREYLGKRVKQAHLNENTYDNIQILQSLIARTDLSEKNTLTQQSLGVIMGDIYVSQVKQLEWKTYEDDLGKSHAVCVKDTKHCIFPITMLSRRISVGLKPDVKRIYDKGYDSVSQYLPKLPFQNQKN